MSGYYNTNYWLSQLLQSQYHWNLCIRKKTGVCWLRGAQEKDESTQISWFLLALPGFVFLLLDNFSFQIENKAAMRKEAAKLPCNFLLKFSSKSKNASICLLQRMVLLRTCTVLVCCLGNLFLWKTKTMSWNTVTTTQGSKCDYYRIFARECIFPALIQEEFGGYLLDRVAQAVLLIFGVSFARN